MQTQRKIVQQITKSSTSSIVSEERVSDEIDTNDAGVERVPKRVTPTKVIGINLRYQRLTILGIQIPVWKKVSIIPYILVMKS